MNENKLLWNVCNISLPRISIIIPVYNVEQYLSQCLESVLAQTFKNYEVILIDDGSSDCSGMICDEYEKLDERIHVIHQKNQGQSVARNRGVDIARGEWIHFVDSDDLIHPQMLEILYRAVIESNVKYCACNRIKFHSPEIVTYEKLDFSCKVIMVDEEITEKLRKNNAFYWTPYASLVHSTIIKNNKFERNRIFEDNAVCFKWIHESNTIAVIDYPMYFYRDNPNGTMNQKFSVKKLDYLWALSEQMTYYKNHNLTKMLNVTFADYVDATIQMCNEIELYLNNSRLKNRILKDSICKCRKYESQIVNFKSYIERLEKRLHPLRHRVKKAIKRRIVG